jgi:hypothetical protein
LSGVRRSLFVWLGMLLAVGTSEPAHAAEPGTLQIGFWCGPPPSFSTPEQFEQIEAAGFTFALPPCDASPTVAENQASLAAAASTSVKVFVRDPRIPTSLSAPGATANLDAVIADYADEAAFGGYFLADEPAASAFGDLGQVVAYLRAHDPAHPAFINVYPNYGPDQGAAYEVYLERYATEAGTAMFSYDHYPFTMFGDRQEFFPNLHSLRTLGLRFARPFWAIGQATPHLAYTQPTEAQKRWQVFQSLAYGARGISYFTYWSVAEAGFGPGIVGLDGTPTAQYGEVQRINASAQAVGRHLATARSTDVFQNPPIPGSVSPRRPGTPVEIPGDAPLTVGVFETDEHVYVLLTNRSVDAPVTTDADLGFGATLPQQLDPATGAWSTVSATVIGTAARTRVTLAPGDGTLFRAAKPVPAGSLGPEVMFGRVRADAGFLHVVDSDGTTYQAGAAVWGQCPANYTNVGQSVESNGFWLCARSDLATRRFYVGNVVANAGNSYRLQNGSTVRERPAGWSECRGTSRHLGRFLDSDGFWVCMEDAPPPSQARAGPTRGSGCPSGFKLDGIDLASDGSWLCARSDLITRRFYAGNAGDGSGCGYVAAAGSWSCIKG